MMRNARKALSVNDQAAVAARIGTLEKATAAEVVCAVATESGRYDRAESLVGISCAVLALFIGNSLLSPVNATGSDWAEYGTLTVGMQSTMVAVGFVVGSIAASYLHAVRRLFSLRTEMDGEVDRAASYVFSTGRLRSTRKGGGVLIYLSLYERQIRILADEGAAAALPAEKLAEAVALALPHLRQNHVCAACMAVVDALEAPLAKGLPSSNFGDNELADTVLIFHPRP